ncbi:MAG: hypothetical protein U0992_07195 [Planctomycetaceae bacterium]
MRAEPPSDAAPEFDAQPEVPAEAEVAADEQADSALAVAAQCTEPQVVASAAAPAQPQWWPQAETASVDFFNSTGVYDAGLELAEDRFENAVEETTAWSPDNLVDQRDPQSQGLAESLAKPANEPPPRETDSILAAPLASRRYVRPLTELRQPQFDSQAGPRLARGSGRPAGRV